MHSKEPCGGRLELRRPRNHAEVYLVLEGKCIGHGGYRWGFPWASRRLRAALPASSRAETAQGCDPAAADALGISVLSLPLG